MTQKEEFLKRLHATFKVEAAERLKSLSAGLLDLEKSPSPEARATIIETIFREAHSFKGAARSVDRGDLEAVCQALESALAGLQRGAVVVSPDLLDTLHRIVDALDLALANGEHVLTREQVLALVQQLAVPANGTPLLQRDVPIETPVLSAVDGPPENGGSSGQTEESIPINTNAVRAEEVPVSRGPFDTAQDRRLEAPSATLSTIATVERPLAAETVRVSAAKLDAVMRQVEGMLAAKLSTAQRAMDLRNARGGYDYWKKAWRKVRSETRHLTRPVDKTGTAGNGHHQASVTALLQFLDWNEHHIKELENELAGITAAAEHDRRAIGGMVDNLLDDMKQVLMLPFSTLLETFPKMVRDLSRACGKQVELVIQGGDVEIDRRILEETKDPLMHLVRNAVDHGVEAPEVRARQNKPATATVTITVAHVESGTIEVRVSDDGAGIDPGMVRNAAIRQGRVSPEEANRLNEQEAAALVFRSGVSTCAMVTDLSGRGLGLAIVREKVERVGGSVVMESHPGAGTTFLLLLPLTIATFKGVLVRAATRDFILPSASIERVLRVLPGQINTVENRETISFNGNTVALVRLDEILELTRAEQDGATAAFLPTLVLRAAKQCLAVRVDAVLGEQDVLVKSLGRQLARVRNIAGAAVSGAGKVVPILHVPDLMKSAFKRSAAIATSPAANGNGKVKQPSVLVVEDSITSRMLLVSILQSAGYRVTAVVDGMEAWTLLHTEDFDVIVSDIEMPRMNGFDLTTRIRADAQRADQPVVLVTSLDSREDRERGIDVGANAYIVKSSFDQSNLLEVVRRLI